MATQYQHKE